MKKFWNKAVNDIYLYGEIVSERKIRGGKMKFHRNNFVRNFTAEMEMLPYGLILTVAMYLRRHKFIIC